MKYLFVISLLLIAPSLHSQTYSNTDSLNLLMEERQDDRTNFHVQQLILPTALIAVGTWGICNGYLQKINRSIHDDMEDLRGDHYFRADDYIQFLPAASYLALGAIGVKSRHPFKERLIVLATSYLALEIMVNTLKFSVNEKRPDSDKKNSFPSNHAATAFMGAELIREEYGIGYAIGAYAVACGVAFFRLYNDKHWFNDVLAGAGFGILSAHIGYWLLPVNRKLFKIDKDKNATVAVCPMYDYNNKAVMGALSINF